MTNETPPTKKPLAGLADMLKKQDKAAAGIKADKTTKTIETRDFTITYRKRAFGDG